jgi:Holliday junction resolvasome RuvABC endonuclease subunit
MYQYSLVHQVAAGQNTSAPTKAKQAVAGRGKGSKGRQQSQRQLHLQLLGDPHEDQAAELLQICGVPRSRLACSLAGGLSSVILNGPS